MPVLRCSLLGVNSSLIVRARDGSIETLDAGKPPCKIFAGDKLHLVGNMFPIIFSAPRSVATSNSRIWKPEVAPEADVFLSSPPTKGTPEFSTSHPGKKRKQPDDTPLEDPMMTPAKKQKLHDPEPTKSAFALLMQASKTKSTVPEPKAASGWAGALAPYVLTPEKFPEAVYHHDDKVIVIYDKFPKAKFHFLVMPRAIVDGFRALTSSSVPMLKDMKILADKMVKKLTLDHPGTKFRVGFHAIPSMRQLHMHVISQDFNSEHLKNKKHWNSFTTKFFVDADSFISKLASKGSIEFDKANYEELLKGPIHCVHCGSELSNIPRLKIHLQTCK
eukprot:TRINITY_DN854_c0_g1_i2.p1 TRINITY_DN854_c0_g1~~TRINITY_DN854_c0_g1_i2.p1  ORF type:complete len:332 (-),score=37.79 TRINITY_DN854_c0_g1_i2:91-1086(-)